MFWDEQIIDTREQVGWGDSCSAANSRNSGGSNLIWLEVDLSRKPHGSPPKLTSWIFYRASMSTSILIPKWCSSQLYSGGVYVFVSAFVKVLKEYRNSYRNREIREKGCVKKKETVE